VIALELYGDAGVAVATFLLTLAILIFAEVTPKTIAAYHPEKVAFPASLVLRPLMYVLYPLVWLVNSICRQLVKPFGIKLASDTDATISGEELRTIVGEASAMIPAGHKGMLVNILDLDDVTVDDIMVPRNEIFGVDLAADDAEIVERLLASGYTRVPVYEEEINNILGLFHLRKSPQLFHQTSFSKDALRALIREPYFIPENTPLHTQLQHFQREKRRIGIVVDEYGEVQGLVTLEDILEEIVGEFTSNIADEVEEILPQEDGSYIIDGTAGVRDINKTLGWELPTDGPRTLNGLLLEHLESFPDANVGVSLGPHHFEIMDIANNKIRTVKAETVAREAAG
jgi:Mg2+/Co2+ transporter CorB